MDVMAWLRDLGLDRYETAFRDNEIDWEVLPELSEADLEKLGLPVGPRKKLLKAIAALSAERSSASPATGAEAERRQLTVLFCDLVGSTELSGRLDPEDLSEVMRAYQGCCAEVIGRFSGYVAKYLGDGVLAYFGYPQAHEDDAERAVRAGLGLVAAVTQLRPGRDLALQVRVGIATGLVVVGEKIGTGAAQEETVVGETPNLAARLQAEAGPNSVVIATSTRRLLGGLFECSDLGERRLKGFSARVGVWQVLGEGATASRFEARRTAGLTPFVGREPELERLLDCWRKAKRSEGQVVLVSGEPGIGKSRLAQTLRGGAR
jgi:class 3 adenylate cyclase